MKNAIKNINIKQSLNGHNIFWASVFVVCFALTSHPDIHETANHSYLFLESIFSGNFFNYYGYVESRPLELYYINFANYNIIVYAVFGLWQLPFYAVTKLFSTPVNELALLLYTKVLCVAFFVGCAYLLRTICVQLGLSNKVAYTAAAFFLLNPVAFFSPVIMGQYDTLCLFFMLLAITYYIKGDMLKFSLFMGVGGVFKFFAYLVFIPLLLLRCKKLLPMLKYALISMFLYVPTTLLFLGRTGNAAYFTSLMFERMFLVPVDSGFGEVSLFMLLYALLCVYCFLHSDKTRENYLAVYVPMAVFALLFFSIYWHPQWLVLLMPFAVITTFLQKSKTIWFYIDVIFCFGFFILIFTHFPGQFGANMIASGVIGAVTNTGLHLAPSLRTLDYFINLVPYIHEIAALCFTAPLVASVVFKLPVKGGSVADKLSGAGEYDVFSSSVMCSGIFVIGFLAFWAVPAAFEYLNAFGVV